MPHRRKAPPMARRQFLRTGAGLLAAPVVLPNVALAGDRSAPSDRITIGVIGLGSRGFNLLHSFLREPDTQIVAVQSHPRHAVNDAQIEQNWAVTR